MLFLYSTLFHGGATQHHKNNILILFWSIQCLKHTMWKRTKIPNVKCFFNKRLIFYSIRQSDPLHHTNVRFYSTLFRAGHINASRNLMKAIVKPLEHVHVSQWMFFLKKILWYDTILLKSYSSSANEALNFWSFVISGLPQKKWLPVGRTEASHFFASHCFFRRVIAKTLSFSFKTIGSTVKAMHGVFRLAAITKVSAAAAQRAVSNGA